MFRPTWLATSVRKAVWPAVLAMQVTSMELILRHAATARAPFLHGGRAACTAWMACVALSDSSFQSMSSRLVWICFVAVGRNARGTVKVPGQWQTCGSRGPTLRCLPA